MPFNPAIDEDSDFIPLLSLEDEDNMQAEKLPDVLPILPLRNTVLFPGVVIPITVGRDKSIALIKESYKGDKTIGVVSQKKDSVEEPKVLCAISDEIIDSLNNIQPLYNQDNYNQLAVSLPNQSKSISGKTRRINEKRILF